MFDSSGMKYHSRYMFDFGSPPTPPRRRLCRSRFRHRPNAGVPDLGEEGNSSIDAIGGLLCVQCAVLAFASLISTLCHFASILLMMDQCSRFALPKKPSWPIPWWQLLERMVTCHSSFIGWTMWTSQTVQLHISVFTWHAFQWHGNPFNATAGRWGCWG